MREELTNITAFAKGKRGLVSLATFRYEQVLVKEYNPESAVDTIRHEKDMLIFLNEFGIGPQFFFYDKGLLVREYIEGTEFIDFLEEANKKELLFVLTEVLYQCRLMDCLGVNKFELTRPYKHIIITTKESKRRVKGAVVQIDFERARRVEHPKNVTQFVQCLYRKRVQNILQDKKIFFDKEKLIELSQDYKKDLDQEVFKNIVRLIGGRIRKPETFSEKVYNACARIPYGKVSTYKEIAHHIGVKSYRAIGKTLSHNPFAPHIPCHRVIKSDLSLGGFMGSTNNKELSKKRELLEQEGVKIKDNKIDKKYLFKFDQEKKRKK